jgi:hypothetical protein
MRVRDPSSLQKRRPWIAGRAHDLLSKRAERFSEKERRSTVLDEFNGSGERMSMGPREVGNAQWSQVTSVDRSIQADVAKHAQHSRHLSTEDEYQGN